ncbi:hypothetical protein QWY16_17445 [Planococcus shenhongbingii]|nr:hypothetical protein [Planococcus sp. N016]WKA58260.1 hypothetical protein QWY16_17445 [Planococcus sp. N016]
MIKVLPVDAANLMRYETKLAQGILGKLCFITIEECMDAVGLQGFELNN